MPQVILEHPEDMFPVRSRRNTPKVIRFAAEDGVVLQHRFLCSLLDCSLFLGIGLLDHDSDQKPG